MTTEYDTPRDTARHAATILEYWFSTLDDAAPLDRAAELFRSCHQRWYGKHPARRHVEVVAKFGRFPHRNAIPGRYSTAAEKAFLVDRPGF